MSEDKKLIELSHAVSAYEDLYMNKMQIKAMLIDANTQILEIGRGGGKTELTAKRIIDVSSDMPCETSFFVHKTYVALLTNIFPKLIAYFKKPRGESKKPLLIEGIDYVAGEKDLPKHFLEPRFPRENPKHEIVFANGHVIKPAASDSPESVAGDDGVHAFIEEMKHNKGEKIKTRIFPALRGGPEHVRKSHYYQGITGVSDTARVDLGEDNWFFEFEKNMNEDLIAEIAKVSEYVNNCMYEIYVEKKNVSKNLKALSRWEPRLNVMRKNATYYLRASSFVNKDILGYKFFKTQFENLSSDEFLTSIATIRQKAVANMFFSMYNKDIHTFSDSYIYKNIHEFDIRENFKITASYLKYYNPRLPLCIGYDPGAFQSMIVAQFDERANTLYVIKEFFVWLPKKQGDMAEEFGNFFSPHQENRKIRLAQDRAGNKKKIELEQITTDARLLRSELIKWKFDVSMQSEKQKTIYHYEHFKLQEILFDEKLRSTPKIRIDENECPMLCSAILRSPLKRTPDGRIELDKSSERKVAIHLQAGLTTQLPSAFMYLLYDLFNNHLPNELSSLPRNMPMNSAL